MHCQTLMRKAASALCFIILPLVASAAAENGKGGRTFHAALMMPENRPDAETLALVKWAGRQDRLVVYPVYASAIKSGNADLGAFDFVWAHTVTPYLPAGWTDADTTGRLRQYVESGGRV